MSSQEHQVQEIEETEPLNLTGLLPQKLTPQSQGVKIHQFKKQKQTRRVLQITEKSKKRMTEKQPQPEGKKESSERVLNGIEASQFSDTRFKTMVTRKLNELTENYKNLHGN